MKEDIKYNTETAKIVNYDNLKVFDFSKVKNICFKSSTIIGNIQKNIFTDYENFCVLDNNNSLFINKDRYEQDKDKIDGLINNVLMKTCEKEIIIDNKEFISDSIIYSLCKNPNITRVTLNGNYVLTKKHYDMFKNANIEVDTEFVTKELEDTFDPIILYNKNRKLIGKETYPRLLRGVFIEIKDDLRDYELENFKYISEYCELIISNDNLSDYIKIINRLNELNINIPVCFKINENNKDEFYEFILNNNIRDENIFVRVNNEDKIKVSEFLKYEKILYEMVKDAINLSPFEKYIYAYNITKQFKIYKESDYNKQDSRWLYRLLNNEYIVCVGFSKLFGDLLNKLGINSIGLSVNVDKSYNDVNVDEINFADNKSVEFGGHNRRYVHLIDDKYGINGFFIADPTWDNDLKKDYYNHMIMTNDEVTKAKSYIGLKYDDIFNVNSLEDYIYKMKRIMSRGYDVELKNQIKYILEAIKVLDSSFYIFLQNKYPFINSLSKIPDNVTNLIYELGVYIVSKVNKTVSGDIMFNGIREVYKHSYGYKDENLDNILNTVREYNKEEQEKLFPIRYRINKDGSREIIMNENNKFDFTLESVKKI